jgi:predicted hotdog family 3-hydroxylacyl-ACP dehydratase
MCLLEQIVSWDEQGVICSTQSHKSLANPLRSNDQLSAIHAVEYGAQAVAVHGGLLAHEKGEAIKPGYLAALRQVKLHCSRLDEIEPALTVTVTQLLSDAGNLMYSFAVTANAQTLAEGRVMVVVQPEVST